MERIHAPLTGVPARWWHKLDDGRIQCDLCPRDCKLHEGQRAACGVASSIRRSMSRDLEMSQFWQNLQARLQPAVPKDSTLEPG